MDVKEAAIEYLPEAVPQVRDDDVPPGYKRTEVGVVPSDWQLLQVADFTKRHKQGFYTKENYVESGTRLVRITDLLGDDLDYDAMPRLNVTPELIKQFKVDDGDFLFARSGAIGRYGIVKKRTRAIFGSYIIRFVFDQATVSNSYFGFAYQLDVVAKQLLAITQGSSNININAENIKALIIAVPPTLAEQRAIATALSDADALIAALQRLIAKKRAIKQGTMQALLTGRQRLPGFTGEWETKPLGDVAHIKTGSRNNQDNVSAGAYPFFVRSEHVERINSYAYDCEAILVPGEGKIGEIFHYIVGRFDVHQRVYAITQFAADVCGKFIYFYMRQNFSPHALQNTVKATVDSLRLPTFQNFEMRIPPTREEQTAIATVLADMDAEIEALEARLAKTRVLKAGMMQQLLTGRIRLPLEDAA